MFYKKVMVFVGCVVLICCSFFNALAASNIKYGNSGNDVVKLQTMLMALGYMDNGCATGYFGSNSWEALIKYQQDNSLEADGIAGSMTFAELEQDLSVIDTNKVYGLGDDGKNIRILQQKLCDKGYLGSLNISGVYGQITAKAVAQYQEDNGLKADGIAGPQTLGSLFELVVLDYIIQDCTAPNTEYLDKLYNTLNEEQKDDIYLLSQLITAEAGAEPYIGQVAVGSVVFNRMEYDNQTMRQVIFRKNAFSVVKDGKINKIPTEECRYAAIQAYFGARPVSTARFFNMKHITNSWAATHCQLYTIIGNHAFYI